MSLNNLIVASIKRVVTDSGFIGKSNSPTTQIVFIKSVARRDYNMGTAITVSNPESILHYVAQRPVDKPIFSNSSVTEVTSVTFKAAQRFVQENNVTEANYADNEYKVEEFIEKVFHQMFVRLTREVFEQLFKEIQFEYSGEIIQSDETKKVATDTIKYYLSSSENFTLGVAVEKAKELAESGDLTNEVTDGVRTVEQNKFLDKVVSVLNRNGYIIRGKENEDHVKDIIFNHVNGETYSNVPSREFPTFIMNKLKTVDKTIATAFKPIRLTNEETDYIYDQVERIYNDNLDVYGGLVTATQIKGKVNLADFLIIKTENMLNYENFQAKTRLYIESLFKAEIANVATGGLTEVYNVNEHLSIAQQIEVLDNNVVRLLFSKGEGEYREMWATRNVEIIKQFHRFESDEEFQSILNDFQKNYNYVPVFDITLGKKRAYNPTRLLTQSPTGTPSWVAFKPNKDGWFENVFLKGVEVGITNTSGVALDEDIQHTELRQEVISRLDNVRFNLDGGTNQDDQTSEETITDQQKELIKELTKGRMNPFVQVLKDWDIQLKTMKTFIEPLARHLLNNLSILNRIQVTEDNKPVISSLVPLFADDIKSVYDQYGIVKAVGLSAEEVSRFYSIMEDTISETNSNFRTDITLEDASDIMNMQEIKAIKKEFFADEEVLGDKQREYCQKIVGYLMRLELDPSSKVFDPRVDLDVDGIKEKLDNHVVRVKFTRSDMQERIMWATSNKEIVRHYLILAQGDDYEIPEPVEVEVETQGEHEEEILTMSTPLYVMDLEARDSRNSSRHLVPSRISSLSNDDMPSFIMFNPKKHLWYKLLHDDQTQLDELVINKNTGIVDDSNTPDDTRYLAEQERVAEIYQQARERAGLPVEEVEEVVEDTPEEEVEIIEEEQVEEVENTEPSDDLNEQELRLNTYRMVQRALDSVDNWIRYDKDLFKQIGEVIQQHNIGISREDGVYTGTEIKMVGWSEQKLLAILQVESVTYYISPRFFINDLGYRVFRDRTDTINFGRRALTLDTDKRYEGLFTELNSLVSKRRDINPFQLGKLGDKNDLERLKRLAMFTSPRIREQFDIEHLSARFINMKELSHLEITFTNTENQTEKLLLTPATLLNQTTGQIYHQRKAKESTLSVFLESYKLVREFLPHEVFVEVGTMAQLAFDLRRKL